LDTWLAGRGPGDSSPGTNGGRPPGRHRRARPAAALL